jgi:hypothetical protein
MVGLSLQLPTNKASIGRKAALGLRQIAALMAPSVSTQSQSLLRAPSCRQCGNFLHLSHVVFSHILKYHPRNTLPDIASQQHWLKNSLFISVSKVIRLNFLWGPKQAFLKNVFSEFSSHRRIKDCSDSEHKIADLMKQ